MTDWEVSGVQDSRNDKSVDSNNELPGQMTMSGLSSKGQKAWRDKGKTWAIRPTPFTIFKYSLATIHIIEKSKIPPCFQWL